MTGHQAPSNGGSDIECSPFNGEHEAPGKHREPAAVPAGTLHILGPGYGGRLLWRQPLARH